MFIYVIGPREGPQKIGLSKDVNKRLQTLQTGFPSTLFVHHKEPIVAKQVRLVEKKIHTELNYKRVRGEWFNLTPEEATDYIRFLQLDTAKIPYWESNPLDYS